MAQIKITALPAYADPASTDVLPIVDVGADVTKKVSIADLLKNASAGTAAAPGIAFDGDNTGIYSPGADQLAISTNGTGRLFVDPSGNVAIGGAGPAEALRITNDRYVRLASGSGGIQFNGDTATANALDDYEEGIWTPTFTGNTTPGTPVYSTNSRAGKYTKIGNYVQVQAYIEVTSIGGAVGDIVITGLPFSAELSFFGASGIGTGHASGSLGNSVRIYNNSTIAELRNNNATVSVATGTIYLSFGYRVK